MNIIFDLDGTLIDSAPDIQALASGVLSKHGRDNLTLQETRDFIGEGSAVFVSRMMAAREMDGGAVSHAAILKEFLAQYELAVDKAVFYPGVLSTLEKLTAADHKLGLCTNKPEMPARAVLRYMGIARYFGAVMAGGMIQSRKPEPDMLLQTISMLGGGPTLYVGDSEIDAETARRAKVPFALYCGGYRKTPVDEMHHDWRFDHFDSVPEIIADALNSFQ